jgi:hypothetical protein
MTLKRNAMSHKSKGRLAGALVLLILAFGLSGCIVDAGAPVHYDVALGTVRVTQGTTAGSSAQTLDEYGLFYSTDRDDVVAIDPAGSASATIPDAIRINPDVKQVRVLLTEAVAPNAVGSHFIDAKKLTPGVTYYFRGYSIGHVDSSGVIWRTLYDVFSRVTADPTLKSLKKSTGTLSPAFSRLTYNYKDTIKRTKKSSTITVVPNLSNSTVKMKIDAGAWTTVNHMKVSVSKGHSKTLTVRVTTASGIVADYTVVVYRKK